MIFFLVALFFLLGLVIGSFLNVVVFRMHSGESGIIAGTSHCRDCKKGLKWYDNVPLVSYLFLRGKCRFCKSHISLQYPLVEFFSAIVFACVSYGTFVIYGPGGQGMMYALLYAIVFAAMIVVFIYDFKYMEVPMIAVWLAVGIAIFIMLLHDISLMQTGSIAISSDFFASYFFTYGMAGIVSFLFFFGLSYFSHEKWMGYGDGFIALVLGLILGPLGGLVAILLAVWSGALIGVLLAFMSKKTMKSAIPFGPFLVAGLFLSFMIKCVRPEIFLILW